MASKIFEEAINAVTPERQGFIALSIMVVKRIRELMDSKGMSQNDLAAAMEKSPSEISKWLSGMHNFTLRSLAKLEVVLGAPIIAKATDFDEEAFQKAPKAFEENLNTLKEMNNFENQLK